MRVVLFASAMLVAVGQALKLESSGYETTDGHMEETEYAQTGAEQLGTPMGLGGMAIPD